MSGLSENEDHGEDGGATAPDHTSYERRPEHEVMLADLLSCTPTQLITRLAVKKHTATGFIASEVIVTLIRSGFGESAKTRNEIALALQGRILSALERFLRQNPQWYGVVDRDSEAKKEIPQEVWKVLMSTNAEVSFAEVTFLEFLQKRFLDWFRSRTALKNSVPSIDSIVPPKDEDGEPVSLVGQIEDEDGLTPEEQVSLKQLIQKSQAALFTLPRKERNAIYFCFECEYTQAQAAEFMKTTERSVRTYLKSGLAKLRKGGL